MSTRPGLCLSLDQIKEALGIARAHYLDRANYSKIFVLDSVISIGTREKMLKCAAACTRALAALEGESTVQERGANDGGLD